MKPKKSLSKQLLFEVSLFQFHFFSALQYLDCYYNEHPLKKNSLVIFEVAFETYIFSVLLLFLEI